MKCNKCKTKDSVDGEHLCEACIQAEVLDSLKASHLRESMMGLSNQDQELAAIRDTWIQTEPDMQDEFVSWLESDDVAKDRDFLATLPAEWVRFVKLCCAAGLRESVLSAIR